MKAVSGIQAAWLEHDGKGSLSISGRGVKFVGEGGFTTVWHCSAPNEADHQIKLFRAATKYEATRNAA